MDNSDCHHPRAYRKPAKHKHGFEVCTYCGEYIVDLAATMAGNLRGAKS